MKNASLTQLLFACLFLPIWAFGQTPAMQLKLQLMPDGVTYGVYVKPKSNYQSSSFTITGSGQVTVVMPDGFQWGNLTSVSGSWATNAIVGNSPANHPIENPAYTYWGFGLQVDVPQIVYQQGVETLLFTFKNMGNACPDTLYLIDDEVDPFAQLPNSYNSNPGNEISIFAAGTAGYSYANNYAPSAWNCHDSDGDGILNAHEDTNGNGVYDPGADSSDLHSPPVISFSQLPASKVVCAGGETIFTVSGTASNPNFDLSWEYSKDAGSTWATVVPNNVFSQNSVLAGTTFHDTLWVSNTTGLHENLFRASVSSSGAPVLSPVAALNVVEPAEFSTQPATTVVCDGDEVFFSATTVSQALPTEYRWQGSSDQANWFDLEESANFKHVGTNELTVANSTGLGNWLFRLSASNAVCVLPTNSQPASLIAEGPIELEQSPADFTGIEGGSAVFHGSFSNLGSGTVYLRWQFSADGQNWSDLVENQVTAYGGIFTGTTTNTLAISLTNGLDGYLFRLRAATSKCEKYSEEAGLSVSQLPTPAMQLKLQLLPDGITYGVYVKPNGSYQTNLSSITSAGRVTVVMPDHFQWGDLTSQSGSWAENWTVGDNSDILPSENPAFKYVSFTLQMEGPQIQYWTGSQTPLFSFKNIGSTCPDTLYLMENGVDPFDQLPNSFNVTPKNDLTISVPGTAGYSYANNYAPAAWNCHDNDGDGTLNAHEDTNGNGVFDAGDYSDLNDPESPYEPNTMELKLQLMPDGETYGVYVRPTEDFENNQTATASAQVTVVMPDGFEWGQTINYSGNWSANSIVGEGNPDVPTENPGMKYVSFGLLTDNPTIVYKAGEETLLFTFKKLGDCPDTLYLMDNVTDPFNQLPNSVGNNPGNDFNVFNFNGNTYYFANNYAPSAWNCHDSDGDGILNAHEDTNGNGVFDPNEDVSNLHFNNLPEPGCVRLKLQLNSDTTGWTVVARPNANYVPSSNTLTTEGRVTIIASNDFELSGLTSHGGDWAHVGTVSALGRNYHTFELQGSTSGIEYVAGADAPLFSFEKPADCPNLLRILENQPVPNVPANVLLGNDLGNLAVGGFEYCGVFDRKAWRCKSGLPGIHNPPMVDSLPAVGNGTAELRDNKGAGELALVGPVFQVSPNPASAEVRVSVGQVAGQVVEICLFDLQGRQLLTAPATVSGKTNLDVSALQPGMYLLALRGDGQLLQRQKLVVN